ASVPALERRIREIDSLLAAIMIPILRTRIGERQAEWDSLNARVEDLEQNTPVTRTLKQQQFIDDLKTRRDNVERALNRLRERLTALTAPPVIGPPAPVTPPAPPGGPPGPPTAPPSPGPGLHPAPAAEHAGSPLPRTVPEQLSLPMDLSGTRHESASPLSAPKPKPPGEGAAARLPGTEMELSHSVVITDPPAALHRALSELS